MNHKIQFISGQIALLYRLEVGAISNLLEEYNVTFAQLPFLANLYKEQGISQDRLAYKAQVDKANATRALKQMEQKGLITRETNPNDARSKLVYLTEDALSIKQDLFDILTQWNEVLVEGLTENEIEMIKSVNEKMIRNAKRFREKSDS